MLLYLSWHLLALLAIGAFAVWKGRLEARADPPPHARPPLVDPLTAGQLQHVCGRVHFDGITGGIDVPVTAAFAWGPAQSFSIECWLKTDARIAQKPAQVVIGRDEWARRSDSGMHWWVGLWGKHPANPQLTGKAAFVLRDKQGNSVMVTGKRRLDNGRWHHLTAVRDAASGQVFLYVDGKREASVAATFPSGFDSTVSPFNVGWLNHAMHGGSNNRYRFRGTVNSVRVYGYVIDQ